MEQEVHSVTADWDVFFYCIFIDEFFYTLGMGYGRIFPKYRYSDPLPSEVAIFTWKIRTVLNQMKKQHYDFCNFYLLSYDLLYLQFTKYLLIKKMKLFKSVQIYRKEAYCSENYFFVHEFFVVRLWVLEIWSILCMVDFDVWFWCILMYAWKRLN